jgi:uncharacterized Tic20 family protein
MTTAALPAAMPVPTQDERTMALLVNVLAIFSSFLAPLIFYLVKKDSRFVSFYSLQALFWHAAYAVIFFVGMIIAFIFMFATIVTHPHNASDQAPPLAFFRRIRVALALRNGRMGLGPRSRNCLRHQGESGGMGAFPGDWRSCAAQNFA